MPTPETSPINEIYIVAFNPILGTPAGGRFNVVSPVRGRIISCGFSVNSLNNTSITMAVATDDHASTTASNFTQIITSTIGTFSSTGLFEGGVASVAPPSPAFITQGGTIQFTCSGGATSVIGGTVYAVIRKA